MGVAEDVLGRIAGGELVIIDGGMGSQLQAEGVPMDELAWSARANLDQPGVVQHVHEEYIRAGAEVIIANTYASGRAALEPAGLGSRVAEANRSAVRAALRAREAAATGPVAVAGSMSSFSAARRPGQAPEHQEIGASAGQRLRAAAVRQPVPGCSASAALIASAIWS